MSDAEANLAAEQRRKTVERLIRESEALEQEGIPGQIVMETMVAMGVTAFVSVHGKEAAAAVVETLPQRIREGAFGDLGTLK